MQLNFTASPIIQSGPSGVKVSAKTFMPLVARKTEVEQWQENTGGDEGGDERLFFNDSGAWWERR